jgi:hypothetical protein
MDPVYYKLFNTDLNKLSDIELIEHYNSNKNKENRLANKKDFYKKYCDFSLSFYKSYIDLIGFNEYQIIEHYYKFGWEENRIISEKQFIETYPDFDCEFYKNYCDVSALDNTNIYIHYLTYGKEENRIISQKQFTETYPDFDCEFYKKFNSDLNLIEDNDCYNHFINIGKYANKKYFEYDFEINNLSDMFHSTHEINYKIYDHTYFRKIRTYEELKEYNKQFIKSYYICGKKSFNDYYSDFDFEFYKKTYFNNSKLSDLEIMTYYHLRGKSEKQLINDKIKIIIYSLPFNIKCGGIVILHYLAKLINNMINAKFYVKFFLINNLKYKNYFCNDFASIDEINDKTIVIYPEIVFGNPLNSKHVVRWILLALGIEMPIDHHKNWDKNDLIYYWENKEKAPINSKQLICPWLNPLFKNYNKLRTKTCYLIKKGRLLHKNINFIHPKNSINIKNMSLNDICNIFNESIYFYCYDLNTAFIIFSVICGCITVLYPLENMTKENYFSNSIMKNNNGTKIYSKGIAWGISNEEIIYAKNTLNEAPGEILELYESYKHHINYFLKDLEQFFI